MVFPLCSVTPWRFRPTGLLPGSGAFKNVLVVGADCGDRGTTDRPAVDGRESTMELGMFWSLARGSIEDSMSDDLPARLYI